MTDGCGRLDGKEATGEGSIERVPVRYRRCSGLASNGVDGAGNGGEIDAGEDYKLNKPPHRER
jgi:hypothetical protein